VFGCPAHAERDRLAGKWLCYPSVATALAASAGLEEETAAITFSDTRDFARRFASLAEATEENRDIWRSGHGGEKLGRYLEAQAPRRAVDFSLFADAVGVAEFLIAGPPSIDRGLRPREQTRAEAPRPADVLSPQLIRVLTELTRG
jgi:hypothetical protein